jgi:hypothetical protein
MHRQRLACPALSVRASAKNADGLAEIDRRAQDVR